MTDLESIMMRTIKIAWVQQSTEFSSDTWDLETEVCFVRFVYFVRF